MKERTSEVPHILADLVLVHNSGDASAEAADQFNRDGIPCWVVEEVDQERAVDMLEGDNVIVVPVDPECPFVVGCWLVKDEHGSRKILLDDGVSYCVRVG